MNKYKNIANLTDGQINVIVGSLLGDGYLTKNYKDTHNCSFRKTQAVYRKEYLNWHYDFLNPYSLSITDRINKEAVIKTTGKIIKQNMVLMFSTIHHPYFTELRKKWYVGCKGLKIIPRDIEINPQVLAIWYADDGSNSQNVTTLNTQGFAMDDVDFLLEKLRQQFSFKCKKVKHCENQNKGYKIVLSSQSHLDFISTVKPFFDWRCFDYKIDVSEYRGTFGRSKSGHPGIRWDTDRNKWLARITTDGKMINLGRFNDINIAIKVREEAVKKYNVRLPGRKWLDG